MADKAASCTLKQHTIIQLPVIEEAESAEILCRKFGGNTLLYNYYTNIEVTQFKNCGKVKM